MNYIGLHVLVFLKVSVGLHMNNLAWTGFPLHGDCDKNINVFTRSAKYRVQNIIAVKAVTFKDEIYVITPRWKRGLLASLWLLVRGRSGVEFQPYPDLQAHTLADCTQIQNAVDMYLDTFGNLWLLDSGIIDSLESPVCTCPPKVVMLNLHFNKISKTVDLSSLAAPTSQLQNIAVEHDIGGKIFVYVSDATHGTILVHDISSSTGWTVTACPAAPGLQITLVKRSALHCVLLIVRLNQPGVIELDTGALKRKSSQSPITTYGERSKPIVLLGSDAHHVYLRHTECSDVLSWDSREVYNGNKLKSLHSPGPRLTPTSVSADSIKRVLLILDSNYGDTLQTNAPTFHRITFVSQV